MPSLGEASQQAPGQCPPLHLKPLSAMKRVEEVQQADAEIVHTESYRSHAFTQPRSLEPVGKWCPTIGSNDGRGWRYCTAAAKPWQDRTKQMSLHVIKQRCAYFDRGKQWMGGTYDADSYVVAAHIGSVPAFHGRNLRTYAALGMGLLPFACEAQSHFYSGTAPYVLTLYDVLPSSVPIVVCSNPAISAMWDS